MDNAVELIGYYGGDLEHALSAWTSTNRDLTEEKRNRIPSLLKMLAIENHHTPFEKSALHFLVTVDTATHIQLLKHRIGVSVNGESARYKELRDDKFYIPPDWQKLKDDKLGWWAEWLEEKSKEMSSYYHKCLEELTPTLGRKRAKESARFFLLYNNQTKMDVMFNFRSFMHFQRLRNEDHAQDEIQRLAQKMIELVQQIESNPFRYSLEAFGYA